MSSPSIAIVIATYGEDSWRELAWSRAYPSAISQGADEVVIAHNAEATIAGVRNELGEKAESEWLCFLDADDELKPGYVGAMRRAILACNSNADYLFPPMVSYVRNGVRQRPRVLPQKNLQDDNWLIVGTVVSHNLFLRVGGFSDYPHGFEDWSLWAKCWKQGATVWPVRDAVYIAHINPNSKHRQGWRDRKWQVETHERVRKELFPELYRQ